MSTTTIDDSSRHEAAANLGRAAAPAVDVLHKVWLAGLGLMSVAGRQTGRMVSALIDEGKHLEPAVLNQGKRAADTVGGAVSGLGKQFKKMPESVGIGGRASGWVPATKEELAAISAKIDALNARLDAMQQTGEVSPDLSVKEPKTGF